MVPRLSLSAEAQLRANISALQNEGPSNVETLVRVACSLAHQNAMQSAIIRQAIAHVGQLEMEQELRDRNLPDPWLENVDCILVGRVSQ